MTLSCNSGFRLQGVTTNKKIPDFLWNKIRADNALYDKHMNNDAV